MARIFPIADLRTLVARALRSGSYTPADSGRIRAVPDTRTIRYYTTLGLIDRPAEMQGRTAMYCETHVLQLVAIKRLQADHQTLSDIQSQIVGIPAGKLRKLANLPADFWEVADRYLAGRQSEQRQSGEPTKPRAQQRAPEQVDAFWAESAALPNALPNPLPSSLPSVSAPAGRRDSSVATSLSSCLRLALHPNVQLIIEGALASSRDPASVLASSDVSRLQSAAVPLLKELARQGLLNLERAALDPITRPSDASNSSHLPRKSQ